MVSSSQVGDAMRVRCANPNDGDASTTHAASREKNGLLIARSETPWAPGTPPAQAVGLGKAPFDPFDHLVVSALGALAALGDCTGGGAEARVVLPITNHS